MKLSPKNRMFIDIAHLGEEAGYSAPVAHHLPTKVIILLIDYELLSFTNAYI
jgi:hypothetical protein